jgi:hypothetical protein
MSKLADIKTNPLIAAEQFIVLCRNNKYEEVSAILKRMTHYEISTIIHTNNDEAFKSICWLCF